MDLSLTITKQIVFTVCMLTFGFQAFAQNIIIYGDTRFMVEKHCYSNAYVLKEYLNDGYWIVNDTSNGNITREVGEYKNRKKNGSNIMFDTLGMISCLRFYNDGVLKEEFTFENGKPITQKIYTDFPILSSFKFWSKEGYLKEVGYDNYGDLVGSNRVFHPNGNLALEACYTCCLPDGTKDTTSICKKGLYVQIHRDTIQPTPPNSSIMIIQSEMCLNHYYPNGNAEVLWTQDITLNGFDTIYSKVHFDIEGDTISITRYDKQLNEILD